MADDNQHQPPSPAAAAGPAQFTPRFRTDIYPFIEPAKFRGALRGKTALITGSTGALGQALAECFAVAGAHLVLTYHRTKPTAELRERCIRFGAGKVEFVKGDVSTLEGCEGVMKAALELFGTIDVLVNNAGANYLGAIDAQDPASFIHDLAVNLHGPYYLLRLFLPSFRAQRSGCVLNIASRAGTVAVPYSASYCASKAALIHLTACAQREMDVEGVDGVHLYALHPGGIKSAMTLKKYAQDSVSALPPAGQALFTNTLDVYNDSPYLNGMVCVALATGVGKQVLRGKYFDVGQDLEDVLAQEAALKADPDLYALHTTFLGALANSGAPPGGYHAEESKFAFPGFEC